MASGAPAAPNTSTGGLRRADLPEPKLRRHSGAVAALPPPAILPDLLADQAGHPRLLLGDRHDRPIRRAARDFKQQLGADRFLELLAVLDRHHERARAADHAVLVIVIEIVDIH